MKTTRIALFAAGTLALVGATAAVLPAAAQPGPGPGGPRMERGYHHHFHHVRAGHGFALGEAFARADADNDGRVTLEEARAWLQARFNEVDANGDGGVTLEEVQAYWQAKSGRGGQAEQAQPRREGRMPERGQARFAAMFRALDANSDGRVTFEEVLPFAEAMFRARDANGDGALSREEIRPGRMGPHREGRRGPPPGAQQQQQPGQSN